MVSENDKSFIYLALFTFTVALLIIVLFVGGCASKPYCYDLDIEKQTYCERGLKRSQELQRMHDSGMFNYIK